MRICQRGLFMSSKATDQHVSSSHTHNNMFLLITCICHYVWGHQAENTQSNNSQSAFVWLFSVTSQNSASTKHWKVSEGEEVEFISLLWLDLFVWTDADHGNPLLSSASAGQCLGKCVTTVAWWSLSATERWWRSPQSRCPLFTKSGDLSHHNSHFSARFIEIRYFYKLIN